MREIGACTFADQLEPQSTVWSDCQQLGSPCAKSLARNNTAHTHSQHWLGHHASSICIYMVLVYEGTALIIQSLRNAWVLQSAVFHQENSTHAAPVSTLPYAWYLVWSKQMYFRDHTGCVWGDKAAVEKTVIWAIFLCLKTSRLHPYVCSSKQRHAYSVF